MSVTFSYLSSIVLDLISPVSISNLFDSIILSEIQLIKASSLNLDINLFTSHWIESIKTGSFDCLIS